MCPERGETRGLCYSPTTSDQFQSSNEKGSSKVMSNWSLKVLGELGRPVLKVAEILDLGLWENV